MCLDYKRNFKLPKTKPIKYKGKIYHLIKVWKYFSSHRKLRGAFHRVFFHRGINTDKSQRKIYHGVTTKTFYKTGFHCYLDKPYFKPFNSMFDEGRWVYIFPKSITAIGKQGQEKVIVARKILIK